VASFCGTLGSFNSTLDSKFCGDCLGGLLPLERGPVKNRELMYAKTLGGRDAAITRRRLTKHGQPTDALDVTG